MSAQIDLEYGFIGDLVTSRTLEVLEYAAKSGLKADFFTDNTTRRAYEKIVELKSDDNELLRAELVTLLGADAVIKALECARADSEEGTLVGSYARRIDKLVKEGRIKEMQSKLSEVNRLAADDKTSVESFAADAIRALQPFTQTANGSAIIRPMKLSDLGPRIPDAENPLALFEDGWLRKGHSAFLVSTAGAGKSVITMQFCYAWALGREMFGIKPYKPLKIAVFQTEDDDDELRFFRDAMSYGYTHNHGWTDEDIEKAVENIDFFPVLGKMGDKFVEYFREIQAKYNYDLVIINPFQGVTDFDIADNTLVRKFTREKLDPIIKDPAKPCGLFIVHHTNKKTGDDNRRPSGGKDVFSQYAGAGAAEINNWMRAGLVILPFVKEGVFGYQLVAAKRGGRLKRWEKRQGYALPTKFISHSNDEANYPFWSEMAAPEADRTKEEKAAEVEKLRAETLENDVMRLLSRITQPMNASSVRGHAQNLFGKSRGDTVYKEFSENFVKYGFMARKGVNNNSKVFGTLAMFENEQTS